MRNLGKVGSIFSIVTYGELEGTAAGSISCGQYLDRIVANFSHDMEYSFLDRLPLTNSASADTTPNENSLIVSFARPCKYNMHIIYLMESLLVFNFLFIIIDRFVLRIAF